ncbi:DUF3299 domain-containing protein [bacterium]|nr:DUF3299 domain-containing protein [bacterium]
MKVRAVFWAGMLMCLFFFARPALALEPIDWEQLVPPLDELQNPYLRLSDDQQQSLYDLWLARETEAAGYGDEDLESLRDTAVAHLAEGGLDADQVLEELDNFVAAANANNSKLVEALNNKNVKIAGYVLPTEFSGDLVIEFLLVPYVGACIHTPPPPANQMIHVEVEEGFITEGMFAPVWVTGKIRTELSTQSIFLVDGSADVNAGYQIKASDIEPYE